jgi:hypothetical protein
MIMRQILPFNSSWCDVNFSIIIYMWSIFNFPDDKLKKSKLSTLKKIQKSYNKEIPYLREKIPSLESSISTTNYIFDYEDYPGERQYTQSLRDAELQPLLLQLNQSKTSLKKLEKLKKRVDPLVDAGIEERNKLTHHFYKKLGKDPLRKIHDYSSFNDIRVSRSAPTKRKRSKSPGRKGGRNNTKRTHQK